MSSNSLINRDCACPAGESYTTSDGLSEGALRISRRVAIYGQPQNASRASPAWSADCSWWPRTVLWMRSRPALHSNAGRSGFDLTVLRI